MSTTYLIVLDLMLFPVVWNVSSVFPWNHFRRDQVALVVSPAHENGVAVGVHAPLHGGGRDRPVAGGGVNPAVGCDKSVSGFGENE